MTFSINSPEASQRIINAIKEGDAIDIKYGKVYITREEVPDIHKVSRVVQELIPYLSINQCEGIEQALQSFAKIHSKDLPAPDLQALITETKTFIETRTFEKLSHDFYYDLNAFAKKLPKQSEELRLKLLNSCLQFNIELTLEHFQLFAISDETQRIILANQCACKDGNLTTRFLHVFEIKDQAAARKLFVLCALTSNPPPEVTLKGQPDSPPNVVFGDHSEPLPQYLKREFPNQREVIELAKECAQLLPAETAANIAFFEISDENILFEIAKHCAINSPSFSRCIKNFHITNQDHLIELAKICSSNSRIFPQLVQDFNIQDVEQRFELAKLAARITDVIPYLKNFNLPKDQEMEVAYLSLEHLIFIEDLNSLGLSEQELLPLLIEAAQKCPSSVTNDIHLLLIKDQTALLNLALLCANNPISSLADRIDHFFVKAREDFTPEEERLLLEVAKQCARTSPVEFARHLKSFGWTDPQILQELATTCFESPRGGGIAPYFTKFKLTDETVRFKLAQKCALSSPIEALQSIAYFDLTAPHRLEVIKLCAKQGLSLYWIDQHIDACQLDEQGIYEVMMEVKTFYVSDLKAIGRFTDKEKLTALAIHFSKFKNVTLLSQLELFQLSDQTLLEQITARCLIHDPDFAYSLLSRDSYLAHALGDRRQYYQHLALSCWLANQPISGLELRQFREEVYPQVVNSPLASKIFKAPLPEEMPTERHLMRQIGFCAMATSLFDSETLNLLAIPLTDLAKYGNTEVSFALFLELFDLVDRQKLASYQTLASEKKGFDSVKSLVMIYPAKWVAAGATASREFPTLFTGKLRKAFKDNQSGVEKLWLMAAKRLDQNPRIPPQKKLEWMEQMMQELDPVHPGKDLKLRHSCFFALYGNKSLDLMPQKLTTQNLLAAMKASLTRDSFLPTEMDHLAEQYLKTLGNETNRFPNAWAVYKTNLQTLYDPALETAYKTFLLHVLKEDYPLYLQTSTNEHVEKIKQANPALWEKWIHTHPRKKIEPQKRGAQRNFSLTTLLKDSLDQGHFQTPDGEQVLPLLAKYLRDPTQKTQCLEACAPNSFEKGLIELCDQKELKTDRLLEALSNLLSQHQRGEKAEVLQDLRGLLLASRDVTTESFLIAEDTTHWEDRLLCGTEVEGSCQRIDGSPNLNRALLSYLLDEKNHILVIKDPDTGKIKARCVLRLLWNSAKNEAALFQECIYPKLCPVEYEEALHHFAKEIAKELETPLYTQNAGNRMDTELSSDVLDSLGSSAPYEYFDAAGGIKAQGKCTISRLEKVVL